MLAIASPPRCPGYQAWSTAGTDPIHGIRTGPPVSSTATIFGWALATAAIRASWLLGSDRSGTSCASVVHCVANTIAMSAAFAAVAAAATSLPSTNVTVAPGNAACSARNGDDA